MPVRRSVYGVNPGSSAVSDWDRLPTFASDGPEVYSPPKITQPKEPVGDPLRGPGSVVLNPLDPASAVGTVKDETADVMSGLKSFLFGSHTKDPYGKSGGWLGDVPVLGNIGRAVTDVAAGGIGLAGDVVGGAANAVGGALEHVSFGVSEDLRQTFDSLPDGHPAKAAALAQIAADGGGEGFMTGAGSYMAEAIKQYRKELSLTATKPGPFDNLFVENASLSDTVENVFMGFFGVGSRIGQRAWSGISTPGQGDRDRLQTILDVGDGKIAFTPDKGLFDSGILSSGNDAGLNEIEQHVYNMVKDNRWDRDTALDYLTSHEAGVSHHALGQLGGAVALDPTVIGSFGSSLIARAGVTGQRLLQVEKVAQEALDIAKAAGKADDIAQAEKLLDMAQGGIKTGDSVRKRNILGQIGKEEWSGDVARSFGRFYTTVSAGHTGQIAKATRTIIDPFHLWGDSPRIEQAIEEGSQVIAASVARTHGEANHGRVVMRLGSIPGVGDKAIEAFTTGLAIYSGNVFRRVVSRRYQATQTWRGVLRDLADPQKGLSLGNGLKDALRTATKDTLTRVDEEVSSFIKYSWTDEDMVNLARRSAGMIEGGMDEAGWREVLEELRNAPGGNEQLSMIHASTYGLAVSRLHKAIEAVKTSGAAAWPTQFGFQPEDLILLNRTTLTDIGLGGIKSRMTAAIGDIEKQMAEIADAKFKYPMLRNFQNDPTSNVKTIEAFMEHLDNISPRLATQIKDAERGMLPDALRDYDALITPNAEEGIFTLGFKPKPEYRWGVEEDITGTAHVVGDPWFEQISDVTMSGMHTFRGVRELSYNAAGMPLEPIVKGAARLLDAGEQAGRTLFRGVTGSMVTQAAHKKFVSRVSSRTKAAGLSEAQAEELWQSLAAAVNARRDISGMRGLSKEDMWTATRSITRKWPSAANYGPRELMLDVMYAYEGDLRTVGLTQKFSGRVKSMIAQHFDRNIGGAVAEHIWPMLKFRYNPIFQMQEKFEPWVLGAWRGIKVAPGSEPTELDRMTAALYRRYIDSNLVAMADQDIAELSAKFAIGSELEILSMDRVSAIANLREKLTVNSILDVQGTKRLNLLRTFRKGLARDMRASWDKNLPGEFDNMLAHARKDAGYFMEEDEFAARWVNSNLNANDVTVREYRDANGNIIGWDADYENAIKEGWEAAPQHIGELRPLDISRMVRRLALESGDGYLIGDEVALRRALASGDISMDYIERELRDLGAHAEYIQRVQASLRFNWNDFWRDVKAGFSLTDDELSRMRNFYARAAERRGMTPVEYLSQVYSPNIARGGQAGIGSLGSAVEYMRNGRRVTERGLAQLVAGQGADSRALYRQMGAVAVQHLDPSGKAALIRGLIGSVDDPGPLHGILQSPALDSIDNIEDIMNDDAVLDALAGRLMGYFQGSLPTGAVTEVALDALPELGYLRNAVTSRLVAAGSPPPNGRALVADNPELLREAAEEVQKLPLWRQVWRVKRTGRDMTRIDMNSVAATKGRSATLNDLSGEARSMPAEVKQAYVDYVNETRALYRWITEDLGISVQRAGADVPYANADELRADLARKDARGRARPRIRVPAVGNFHPALTTDDALMARVVNDVLGYGQEATQFGDDAATFAVMRMYDGRSRGIILTEQWGKKAEAGFSQRVLGQSPVDEYELRFGRYVDPAITSLGPEQAGGYTTRTLGPGVYQMDEAGQSEFVGYLTDIRTQFGGVEFGGMDLFRPLGDGSAEGITYIDGRDYQPPSIGLDTAHGRWGLRAEDRAVQDARHAQRIAQDHLRDRVGWPGRPTYMSKSQAIMPGNTRPFASYTRKGTMLHEWGHAIDSELHRRSKVKALELLELESNGGPKAPAWASNFQRGEYEWYDDEFAQFMRELSVSDLRMRVSGYAQTTYNNPSSVTNNGDLLAEMTALGFADDVDFERHWAAYQRLKASGAPSREYLDPKTGVRIEGMMLDEADLPENAVPDRLFISNFVTPSGTYDGQLLEAVHDFRENLRRLGIWTPDAKPAPATTRHYGRTVEEVNAGYTQEFADPRRLSAVIRQGDLPGEPGYLYHVTDDVYGIQSEGFLKATTPDYRGEQEFWPDGSAEPRSYWAMSPEATLPYISPDGTYPGIIRVKSGAASFGLAANETYADVDIGIANLEVLTPGGAWVPLRDAGTTVGGPGTIPAEPRYGLLPQDLVDRVSKNYLGTGRFSEADPNVARIAHYVRQNMSDASESFFGSVGTGADEVFSGAPASFNWDDVFGSKSGMPNVQGAAYDRTQGILWDSAVQSMAAKWQDAFRLQYFQQNRSMLQRSINHPMFGLYPASYMWGKIAPELIKFMALQPFGVNTGGGARVLADLQMSVGLQRQYDPEFDAKIEELGHSPTLDFLGYMVPATPWELPASYPAWMRSFAQQGLEMQAAAGEGGVYEDVDWIKPVTDTLKRTAPWSTYVPWMGRVAEELSGVPDKNSPEFAAWDAEQRVKALLEQGQQPAPEQPGGATPAPDLSVPTPATNLAPTLQQQMEELQRILSE